jgi:hypothetical protein
MDVVAPLIGVVLGGLLVLVSDVVRRESEWRRELVTRLVTSGTDVVVLLHRTVGELAEATELSTPVANPDTGRADRLQAYSRFYANPGSRALRPHVDRVLRAHRAVRVAHDGEQAVLNFAAREYWDAVEEFELALHRTVVRGRPPRDPRKPLPSEPPHSELGVPRAAKSKVDDS